MRPGQHTHFAADWAHLGERTSIQTKSLLHNLCPHPLFAIVVQKFVDLRGYIACLVSKQILHLLTQGSVALGTHHFFGGVQHCIQASGCGLLHPLLELHVDLRCSDRSLWPADLLLPLELDINQGLHASMGEKNRLQHLIFTRLLGLALDHDHGIARTSHHQIDRGLFLQRLGRVEYVAAIDISHPGSGNGPGKGYIREAERHGSAVHGQHIGLHLRISGKNRGDHLGFRSISVRKKRTQGAVNQAAGQGFPFARTANFTAEITAWDTAGCIHLFLVLDGQRQETEIFFFLFRYHGDQYHGFPTRYHHRTVGLSGHLAGFKDDGLIADLRFYCSFHSSICSLTRRSGLLKNDGSRARSPRHKVTKEGGIYQLFIPPSFVPLQWCAGRATAPS